MEVRAKESSAQFGRRRWHFYSSWPGMKDGSELAWLSVRLLWPETLLDGKMTKTKNVLLTVSSLNSTEAGRSFEENCAFGGCRGTILGSWPLYGRWGCGEREKFGASMAKD